MDNAILRLSPENFVSIAILSGFAFLGVVGAKLLVSKFSGVASAAGGGK
jgi:hypothetical protein